MRDSYRIHQELKKPACHNCSVGALCFPACLTKEEIIKLEKIILKKRKVRRHDYLFQANESFHQLYIIQFGIFKSYYINTEGEQQINEFNLPTELLGLDGFHSGKHCLFSQALENSFVCEIPFKQLLNLAGKIPHLQERLFHIISKNYKPYLHVNFNTTAEIRLASFLLNMCYRLHERGLPAHDFILSMSREDIGNYLGLTSETISRMLHNFEREKVLSVKCRHIHINDLPTLKKMSCI